MARAPAMYQAPNARLDAPRTGARRAKFAWTADLARSDPKAAELAFRIGRNERGLYMGVQQTFGGLARVIVPIFAGITYDHLGHSIPFFVSAGLVMVGFFVGMGIDDPRKPSGKLEGVAAT